VVHGFFILAESTACLIAWRLNEVALESERSARVALERANVELAEAQELAHIGSWEWDLTVNEVWWSDQLHEIFGVPKSRKPTYDSFLELVHPDDRLRVRSAVENANAVGGKLSYECRVVRADGEIRLIHALGGVSVDSSGAVQRLIGTVQDITERKALEQEVEYQAFHDALTGLANRALFLNRVDHALSLRNRTGLELTVLFLDLDDFKSVNDTLGHAAGDQLLAKVAERLTLSLRPSDTVARIGGDEFAVLLEGSDAEVAAAVVSRIHSDSENPIHLLGTDLTVRASIGIAVADGHLSAEELLRDADIAMYSVKNRRQEAPGSALFEPEMRNSIVKRLELKTELHHAVEREELVLHFQPIVDLTSQVTKGLEALVRWEHPERGMIPPNDFIPLAEETGLIVPLGEWVLREATLRAKELQESLGQSIYVAVNLSARQLHGDDVSGLVARALAHSGLKAEDLVLEITETSLMEDASAGEKVLHELRSLGVRLAIDDFGTGYSSLSYLRRFPLDILKIDRSFIRGITEGPEESALAQALIQLSRIMTLDTVAEGIETEAQLARLRALGCKNGQGYLFSKPLPAAEIAQHLLLSSRSAAIA
jgi:diguanylate cyclase (GGDEF)-like protein/PAS domain S-box-containing protein